MANASISTIPAHAATIEPTEFRSLMSTFPTGVSIVTTGAYGGEVWGMTCSAVCSVSLDPPTLLICLNKKSRTLQAMLRESTFALNLLHDRAQPAAEAFGAGAPDRFERFDWRHDPSFGGPHLVHDTHSIADCRITGSISVGDHRVVFGEVFGISQETPDQAKPLLYGLRRYSVLSAAAER